MAFRTKKISQMDPKGANLASTDLLEISELVSGSYVTKSITGAEIISSATTGYVPYVGATQDLELGANELYTGKLWLYDSVNDNYGSVHFTDTDFHIEDADGHKMLVIEDGFMQIHKTDTIQSNLFTSGLTATRNHYLPDASGTIALTSDLSSYVPTTRTISTTAPLSGGGDLSANRTLSIPKATNLVDGYLSATDWTTFNGKQPTLVSGTNIKTVNGTTILGSGDLTISTGITIGTTAITSGTVGRVLFEGTGNVVSESANITWDNTNNIFNVTGLIKATQNNIYATHVGANIKGLYIVNNSDSVVRAGLQYDGNTAFVELVGRYNNGQTFFRQDGGNGNISFLRSGSEYGRIFGATGNWGINTTTDAGYKLDVNGTARVSGELRAGSLQLLTSGSPGTTGQGITTTARKISFQSQGEINVDGATTYQLLGYADSPVAMTQNASGRTIGFLQVKGGFSSPNFNNTQANLLWINPTYNMSGTANTGQILRGIYYNPTLTDLTNATHYAFHSTSGRHRYENLPTSPTGLASGDLWNNLGILSIV